MPTKYRPITQADLAKEIGTAVLIALIFAPALGGVMSLIFQLIGGIYNPPSNAPLDCSFLDVLGDKKTLAEYQACKVQSNGFDAKLARFERKIPWFWIAFFLIAWLWLRNPLKGRIRDDSEDVTDEIGAANPMTQTYPLTVTRKMDWCKSVPMDLPFVGKGETIYANLWFTINPFRVMGIPTMPCALEGQPR